MKTAALTLGMTLLGLFSSAVAQGVPKNSDAAATDKTPVSPVTPGEVKEAPPVPPAVAPSTKPLPPELITTSLSGKELEFLMTAFENGRVLAWLGETAKAKAQNEQLKALGGVLASTQAKENKVLRDLAKSKGLNVEAGAPPIQQAKIEEELGKGSSSKVDQLLSEDIVAAAKKAVSVYEQGVKAEDEELRKVAEQMLPLAKEKLQLVSKVAGNVPAASKKSGQ